MAILCEISNLIWDSENVHIRKKLDESAKSFKLDQNWSLYFNLFSKNIKEKFKEGIQFQNDNPFNSNSEEKEAEVKTF